MGVGKLTGGQEWSTGRRLYLVISSVKTCFTQKAQRDGFFRPRLFVPRGFHFINLHKTFPVPVCPAWYVRTPGVERNCTPISFRYDYDSRCQHGRSFHRPTLLLAIFRARNSCASNAFPSARKIKPTYYAAAKHFVSLVVQHVVARIVLPESNLQRGRCSLHHRRSRRSRLR